MPFINILYNNCEHEAVNDFLNKNMTIDDWIKLAQIDGEKGESACAWIPYSIII
jgi:hypothetical protein